MKNTTAKDKNDDNELRKNFKTKLKLIKRDIENYQSIIDWFLNANIKSNQTIQMLFKNNSKSL